MHLPVLLITPRWSSWPDDAAINPVKISLSAQVFKFLSKAKNTSAAKISRGLRMSYLRKAEMACQAVTWIQGEIVHRQKTYELVVR